MVMLDTKPEQIDVDFQKAAIIVVDMQNAFVTEGGMFDLAGFDISAAEGVIRTNRQLLDTARKNCVKVIYLQMTYQPDLSDAGDQFSPNYHKALSLRMMRQNPEFEGKLLIKNSWDWQIVDELTPESGDYVITKPRYSGFVGTDLNNFLRGHNIRHILFTGVATNVCVDSTARDAYFHEYWPILVEDAMSHSGPDFNRQSTLWNFENVFGWVTTADQLIQAMERNTN